MRAACARGKRAGRRDHPREQSRVVFRGPWHSTLAHWSVIVHQEPSISEIKKAYSPGSWLLLRTALPFVGLSFACSPNPTSFYLRARRSSPFCLVSPNIAVGHCVRVHLCSAGSFQLYCLFLRGLRSPVPHILLPCLGLPRFLIRALSPVCSPLPARNLLLMSDWPSSPSFTSAPVYK